jgi:hypothetical protein
MRVKIIVDKISFSLYKRDNVKKVMRSGAGQETWPAAG